VVEQAYPHIVRRADSDGVISATWVNVTKHYLIAVGLTIWVGSCAG
jgi:hypothetical protein